MNEFSNFQPSEEAAVGDLDFARLLHSFEESWAQGAPPDLTAFLPNVSIERLGRRLSDLIKLDQRFRWQRGQPRLLEEYLGDWPELSQDSEAVAELLESECLSRIAYATAPTRAELAARFPMLAHCINLADLQNQARTTQVVERHGGSSQFFLIRKLGAGGMGVVYEVIDRQRNSRVALKTLRQKNPVTLYRFKQEFRSLADLSHPNLIPLYELFVVGDEWFFTMPLVKGVDFLSYVRPRTAHRAAGGAPAAGTDTAQDSRRAQVTGPHEITRTRDFNPAFQPERETAVGLAVGSSDGTVTKEYVPCPGVDRETEVAAAATPNDATATTEFLTMREARAVKGAGADGGPRPWEAPLNPDRLRSALRQLARGVMALHGAGKLHRDIKPFNVLVQENGTVVLLDFGLVTELEVQGAPFQQEVDSPGADVAQSPLPHAAENPHAGTLGYMAPEQAAGQALSPASDWYAVGVMLFEALTGRRPFHGAGPIQILRAKRDQDAPAPREFCADIPGDLNQLCIDLLRRNPAARLSGKDLLARLGDEAPGTVLPVDEASAAHLPLVGRQELDFLDAIFATTLAGKAVTVHVHGRSGAGKTTLVQRFLDRLAARPDVVILAGRCFEQESVPYKALDHLVDALTRYLARLSRAEAEALMPRDIGALGRIFPVLMRVEAVAEAPQRALEFPDLQDLRRRAFAALRELLTRLGNRHPLVLCIDDLQWGDADSAALLTDLLRPPQPPRLLLLVCYRSEYVETSTCLKALKAAQESADPAQAGHELQIAPLPQEAAQELALLLLRNQGGDVQGRAEQIARESGGNPYFVYELARHVIEGVDWSSRPGGINLDEVLWTRIQRLPEESRRFLETLAVAGKPVQVRLAYAAGDVRAAERQVVAPLRSGHLVRSTGPSLEDDIETYHDRIRESIIEHLPFESKKLHHSRLAITLEAAGAADAETLAVHFHGGEQHAKAGQYYAAAADLAARALAFDRAAKLYRLSIELRPLPGDEGRKLHTRLAETLANGGRCAEAAREFLSAAEDAGTAEKIDLERRAAYQYCASGHLDDGRIVMRTVLGRVGMKLPDSRFRALAALLGNRFRLWLRGLKFQERAAAHISEADLTRIDLAWSVGAGLATKSVLVGPAFQSLNLLLALRAGEPQRIARAMCWEAAQSSIDGASAMKRTTKLLDAAEAIAQRLQQPYLFGMLALARGYREFMLGRWKSGRGFLEEADRIFREQCTGAAWELGQANTSCLWCMSYEGDWPEVRRRSARLLKEAQEKGDLFTVVNLGTFMEPLVRLAEDKPEEARQVIADSIGRWSREEFNTQNMTALMGATYVDLYRGDPEATYARHCEQWPALKGAFFLHSQICRLLVPELRARSALGVAATSKQPAAYLREAETRARRIERERMPYGCALATLLHAGVAAVRGEKVRAERCLVAAAEAFDNLPMGLFAAAARRRLGELRGGAEGRDLIAASTQWMLEHEIQNPERMTAAIAPWRPH